jgi:hypothetical protein
VSVVRLRSATKAELLNLNNYTNYISAQEASGVNIFEVKDIIGNASESFGYSSGSQTCSGLFWV